MGDPQRGAIKAAVCVADPQLREAVTRALERNGSFECVGHSADLDGLAGVIHADLPAVAVLDERLGGLDLEASLARATVGRPMATLILVEDEAAERECTKQRTGKLAFLARPFLLTPGLAAKSHVNRSLSSLAEAAGGVTRRTIPTGVMLDTLARRQALAARTGVRPGVVTLATWPLDLILLVGGRGNEAVFARVLAESTSFPVPVLVALRPYAALPKRTWATARGPVVQMTGTLPLRRAQGLLVASRKGQIRLSPDQIRALPGEEPLLVADLVRTTGALQSGALTILLSDSETDAAMAMVAAVEAGALGAVLDPSACERAAGPEAALRGAPDLLRLSLAELVWLLANAVPRRA